MMLKFLEWVADKGTDIMNPKTMRIVSAAMLLISIATLIYLPFSGEPPVIYFMSSAALVYTALLALGEAERWTREDPDADPDQPNEE